MYPIVKLRHYDVKEALLAPWSLKTNAAYDMNFNLTRMESSFRSFL